MDLEYLSRVLMRLRPFVRDQSLRRTRLERVLGTLQIPADTIRPEIERLLAKAGITLEDDLPAEPTPVVVVPAIVPAGGDAYEVDGDASTDVQDEDTLDLEDEVPHGEQRTIGRSEAETAIEAAQRRIAADRFLANPAKVLLTAQQEVGLALLIRGSANRPLEQGDFAKLTGEARRAAECLYLHNQGLVHSVAQKYPQTGMTYDDIFQHGAIGLIRAVELFDPSQGNKFSTYAMWWVRQSITRGIANEARLIRLPVHMVERLRKVWKQRALLTYGGQPPSLTTLARACELDEEAVMECLRLGPPDLPSLDMKIGDGEATLADVLDLEDPRQDPDQQVTFGLLQEQLHAVLDTLSEREAGVISLRFGLADGQDKTLDEVGKVYGVTRERIRQIQEKTMKKLHHPSRSQVLRDYLGEYTGHALAYDYGEYAPRQNVTYRCSESHRFDLTLSSEAAVPDLWTCPRCSNEARRLDPADFAQLDQPGAVRLEQDERPASPLPATIVGPDGKKVLPDIPDWMFERDIGLHSALGDPAKRSG